jgi:hypothetical protein
MSCDLLVDCPVIESCGSPGVRSKIETHPRSYSDEMNGRTRTATLTQSEVDAADIL